MIQHLITALAYIALGFTVGFIVRPLVWKSGSPLSRYLKQRQAKIEERQEASVGPDRRYR